MVHLPVKVLYKKANPGNRINSKINTCDSKQHIKIERHHPQNLYISASDINSFKSRKPPANPRCFRSKHKGYSKSDFFYHYLKRNLPVGPSKSSFIQNYKLNKSKSSLIVQPSRNQSLISQKSIENLHHDPHFNRIVKETGGKKNRKVFVTISVTQMKEKELGYFDYDKNRRRSKHRHKTHRGFHSQHGSLSKLSSTPNLSRKKRKSRKHHIKRSCSCRDRKNNFNMDDAYNNDNSCSCEEINQSVKDGPDLYRHILGPTPDETILAGLQTVIDMCCVTESPRQPARHITNEDILNWIESEYTLLNTNKQSYDVPDEVLEAELQTLESMHELMRKKSALDDEFMKNNLSVRPSLQLKLSSHKKSTHFSRIPNGSTCSFKKTLSKHSLNSSHSRPSHVSPQQSRHSIRSKSSGYLQTESEPLSRSCSSFLSHKSSDIPSKPSNHTINSHKSGHSAKSLKNVHSAHSHKSRHSCTCSNKTKSKQCPYKYPASRSSGFSNPTRSEISIGSSHHQLPTKSIVKPTSKHHTGYSSPISTGRQSTKMNKCECFHDLPPICKTRRDSKHSKQCSIRSNGGSVQVSERYESVLSAASSQNKDRSRCGCESNGNSLKSNETTRSAQKSIQNSDKNYQPVQNINNNSDRGYDSDKVSSYEKLPSSHNSTQPSRCICSDTIGKEVPFESHLTDVSEESHTSKSNRSHSCNKHTCGELLISSSNDKMLTTYSTHSASLPPLNGGMYHNTIGTNVTREDLYINNGNTGCSCNDSSSSNSSSTTSSSFTETSSTNGVVYSSGDGDRMSKSSSVPHEIRYAIARISRFPDYTTYEILKSTKSKPKFIPHVTEGIFVLKQKK